MTTLHRHRGFAIVSAIFILVVLAVLGAAILNVSTSQQIGSAQDVQGVRAYQAARAGLEWGLYKVQETLAYNFGYTSPEPNDRRCPGGGMSSTDSFAPGAATLSTFIVTVTCAAATDGSSGPTLYTLTATACNQPNAGACPNTANPNANYIERRLSVAF